jgi:hypothetical protein
MNGTQNLNLDSQTLEQCLKSTTKFGETVYTNICNGQTYSIPMGAMDLVGFLILIAIGLSVIILMLKLVFDY